MKNIFNVVSEEYKYESFEEALVELKYAIDELISLNGAFSFVNEKDKTNASFDCQIKINSILARKDFKRFKVFTINFIYQPYNPNLIPDLKILRKEIIKVSQSEFLSSEKERVSLEKGKVIFDDDRAKIVINGQECQLPPHKQEHFFCRAMFQQKIGEFVDWSTVSENMGEWILGINKNENKKEKRSIQDTVYKINDRIKNIFHTADSLFTWEDKSIKRNY